jgi:hypothetical protein
MEQVRNRKIGRAGGKEKLPPLCSRKLFLLIDLESCKNGGMFFAIRSSIAFSSRHLDRQSISQVKWHKDIAVVYLNTMESFYNPYGRKGLLFPKPHQRSI